MSYDKYLCDVREDDDMDDIDEPGSIKHKNNIDDDMKNNIDNDDKTN